MSGVPSRQDRAAAAVPQVADDFLRLLTESGVLRANDIRDAIQRYDLHCKPSPSAVASTLVTEGLVTQFQANRLLHGRRHGLVIDDYKLLYVLGSGGMGLVYAAEEIETGFKVALKVVSRHHRHDAGMLARFRLEAQAGMSLAHPNILRSFGIKRTEDAYGETEYMVMEYVRGVNLLELIALEKQIPWTQASDIIMQAAVGLEYAHKKKLVHRDVKPENLLIRTDGTVKILDFGLAMLDENDEEFAMAMILGQDRLGTADYVAPEQSVDSYQVDERADIYSLGCTLYFALAGRVPFPVESPAEKIACHRKQRPQPITEIRPEIPERLELILRKMMAKRPEHRVASAGEVVRHLKPFAKRQPVDFDFDRVLRARAKQAEKRIIDQLGRRRAADKTPAPKPAQANVETNVRQDTNLDSKARGSHPG